MGMDFQCKTFFSSMSNLCSYFAYCFCCSCTLFVIWLKVFQNLDKFSSKGGFDKIHMQLCLLSLFCKVLPMLGWAIFLFVKKRLKVVICSLSLPFSSQLEDLARVFMYFSCFTLWVVGRVRRSLTRCVRSWMNWVCVVSPLRIFPELLCVGWVDFYPRMDGYSSKLLE